MKSNTISCLVFFSMLVWVTGYPAAQNNKIHFKPESSQLNSVPVQLFEKSRPLKDSLNSEQSIVGSLECLACKSALGIALWKFRKPDGSYPGLLNFIITLCNKLKIESPAICKGMVNAMGNETLYLLTKLQLTGGDLCGLIFPSKCPAAGLSWNSKQWKIPLPAVQTVGRNTNRTVQGSLMKVLHLSDIHVDLHYKPGSIVDCDDPLCCRPGEQISKGTQHAGYWGSLGYCDTPYWTLENLLAHAASTHKYDYIIWTGDLPAHDDWSQSRADQVFLLNNLTSLLQKYFPKTPIYPALGNHESDPVNSFPPNYIGGYNNISWLYDALSKAWSPWLPESSIETVKQSGYYTVLIKPGFRLISLNMNYCNTENFWMLVDPVDPNGELKWLVDTLFSAESHKETVHIIGHIPPSAGGDCLTVWRNNYYAIINRFKDIITAQFFGHTHYDEIEIMYSDNLLSEPVAMAYICPSVTTYKNLHPGYRIYDVAADTWNVVDHYTYILNLTEANAHTALPKWSLEYSAKKAYNLPDLSLYSWHELFQYWIKNDTASSDTSFPKYYQYFYKGHPMVPTCDEKCRKDLLCRVAAGNFTRPDCDI